MRSVLQRAVCLCLAALFVYLFVSPAAAIPNTVLNAPSVVILVTALAVFALGMAAIVRVALPRTAEVPAAETFPLPSVLRC